MSPHSTVERAQRPHRSWCSQEGGDKPGRMASLVFKKCDTQDWPSHHHTPHSGARAQGAWDWQQQAWLCGPPSHHWDYGHCSIFSHQQTWGKVLYLWKLSCWKVFSLLCYSVTTFWYQDNWPALTEKLLEPYGQSFNMNHFGTLKLLVILGLTHSCSVLLLVQQINVNLDR